METIMRFWFISIVMCVTIAAPVHAQDADTQDLPPAIQDFLIQEREALPPVERHFQTAQDYHVQGELDRAQQELEKALSIDPKHVPSSCELGIVYLGKEEYPKALLQLQKTLELDPEYPKAHYALANTYARMPQPDVLKARKHLDRAVQLGYHAVPWFVEYIEKLEQQAGMVELADTPA